MLGCVYTDLPLASSASYCTSHLQVGTLLAVNYDVKLKYTPSRYTDYIVDGWFRYSIYILFLYTFAQKSRHHIHSDFRFLHGFFLTLFPAFTFFSFFVVHQPQMVAKTISSYNFRRYQQIMQVYALFIEFCKFCIFCFSWGLGMANFWEKNNL